MILVSERSELFLLSALLLCLAPTAARGQTEEQVMLPLRYARVSPRMRRRLRDDWDDLQPTGKEFSYCVAGWTPERTQDGDTIFVVTEIVMVATANAQKHRINGFDCINPDGSSQPIIHAHPSGDCSPSRADIAAAIGREAPFEMILCGRESAISYNGQLYRKAILGYSLSRRP